MSDYKYLNEGKQHLHTYKGQPLLGTSSVVGILNKPLVWWGLQVGLGTLGFMPEKKRVDGKYISNPLVERVAKAQAWLDNHPKELFLEGSMWLDALQNAYVAHSEAKDTAADKGTQLHDILSRYIKA